MGAVTLGSWAAQTWLTTWYCIHFRQNQNGNKTVFYKGARINVLLLVLSIRNRFLFLFLRVKHGVRGYQRNDAGALIWRLKTAERMI